MRMLIVNVVGNFDNYKNDADFSAHWRNDDEHRAEDGGTKTKKGC